MVSCSLLVQESAMLIKSKEWRTETRRTLSWQLGMQKLPGRCHEMPA